VGAIPVFRDIVRVNNITTAKQLAHVLLNVDTFTPEDVAKIERKLADKKLWIGIKQLLAICTKFGQIEQKERAGLFVMLLETKGYIRDDLT
jgi:vesicle-fusing ATPase